MNVTDLVNPAGAGSMDRWVRSINMNQLISRKSRDMRHFDENDWTIIGWQDRRVLNDAGTHGEDSNEKDISNTDTIIGVVYVGVLIILMLLFLT